MTEKIVQAIEKVENLLGLRIPERVWVDVLQYSVQKLQAIGKPETYLPVLFQNELADYYTRMDINMKGAVNNV